MSKYDQEAHSKRTYNAAKQNILNDPQDPFGGGLADQLITEAHVSKWKILGIALKTLANGLKKHPEKIQEVREKLK